MTEGDLRESFEDIPKRAVAVKLKGIPFDANKEEVQRWFSDDDIKVKVFLHKRRDGKSNGMGFAVLRHKDDEERALQKSNTMMKDRYILVTKVSVPSVKKQLDLFKSHDTVLHLVNIPEGATEDDIQKFFRGLEITADGININRTADGQWTGKALVEFASAADASEGLKKYGEHMGENPIKVWTSTVHQYKKMMHVKKYGRPLKSKSKKKNRRMDVDGDVSTAASSVVPPAAPETNDASEGKKKKKKPSLQKRKRMARQNKMAKELAKKENGIEKDVNMESQSDEDEMEIDGRKRKHRDEGKVAKKKRKTKSGAVDTGFLKIKKTKEQSTNDGIDKQVLNEIIEEGILEKKKKKKKKNKGEFMKEEVITSMLANVNVTDEGQSVKKKKKKDKSKATFKVKSHSGLEKLKKKKHKKKHSV